MQYFKKVVGGDTEDIEKLKAQLKRRGDIIEKLKDKNKKMLEDKEFAQISFQDIDKKYRQLQANNKNENAYLKQNMEFFVNNLQKIPTQIAEKITQGLLSKLEEQVGEKVEQEGLKSYLDLDFNYKSLFADYVAKVFQLTKQKVAQDLKKGDSIKILEEKLANKDKEIQEIIDRYENNQKSIEKQHLNKINNKIQEFNIIREQKDIFIRETTDNLGKIMTQNEEMKKQLAKYKHSESQLKIQKEKIQKKFSESCEMNNHLLNKNTELEMELKTIKAQNQIMMAQLINQNQQIKQMLNQSKQENVVLRAEAMKIKEETSNSQKQYSFSLNQLKKSQEQLAQYRTNIANRQDEMRKLGQSNDKIIEQLNSLRIKEKIIKDKCNAFNTVQFKQQINRIKICIEEYRYLFQTKRTEYESNIEQLLNNYKSKIVQSSNEEPSIISIQQSNNQSTNFSNDQVKEIPLNVEQERQIVQLKQFADKMIKNQKVLKQQLSRLQQLQKSLTQTIEMIKGQNALEKQRMLTQIKNITQELKNYQEIKQQYQQLKLELCQRVNEVQQLKLKLAEIQERNKEKDLQLSQSASKDIDVASKLKQNLEKITLFEQELNILRENNGKLQANRNQILIENQEKDAIILTLQQQNNTQIQDIRNFKVQLQRLNEDYSYIEQDYARCQHQLKQAKEESEQIRVGSNEKDDQISLLNEKATQLQRKIIIQVQERLKMEGQILTLKDEIQSKTVIINEKEQSIQQMKGDIQAKIKIINEKQAILQNITSQSDTKSRQITQNGQQIQKLKTQLLKKVQQMTQIQQQLHKSQNNLLKLNENHTQTTKNMQQLKHLKEKIQKQGEQQVRQLKSRIIQLQNKLQQKEKQQQSNKYQRQRLQQRIKILTQDINSKEGQTNNSMNLIDQLQNKYREEILSKHQWINSLQSNIKDLRNQIQSLQVQRDKMHQEYIELQQKNAQIEIQDKEAQQKMIDVTKSIKEQYQTQVNRYQIIIQDLNRQIQTKDQQIKQSKQSIQREISQKKEIHQQLEEKQLAIVAIQKQIQTIKEEKVELQKQGRHMLDELTQSFESKQSTYLLSIQKSNLELNEIIKTNKQIHDQTILFKAQIQSIQAQLIQKNAQLMRMETQRKENIEKIKGLQETIRQKQENLELLNAEIIRYQRQTSENINNIQILKDHLKQVEEDRQNYKRMCEQNSIEKDKIQLINKDIREKMHLLLEQMSQLQVSHSHQLQQYQKKSRQQLDKVKSSLQQKSRIEEQFRRNIEQKQLNLQELNQKYIQMMGRQQYLQIVIIQNEEIVQKAQAAFRNSIKQLEECLKTTKQGYEQEKRLLLIQLSQLSSQNESLKNRTQQLSQEVDQATKNSIHLHQKITQLHQQINQYKIELELSQATSNQMLNSIAILRRQLEQKVTYYQDMLQKSIDQIKSIQQAKNLQIQQTKIAKNNIQSQLISSINEVQQKLVKEYAQRTSLIEQLEKKSVQLKEKSSKLLQLQQKLAQQIALKNQALQDQQFMSQLYKDFQARQSQMSVRQQKMKEMLGYSQYFLETLHKDFNKQSINFIKSSIDLMNVEIKQLSNTSKAKQGELETVILKLRQDVQEQTTIAEHYEKKLQTLSLQLEDFRTKLQQKETLLEKLRKEAKTKELDLLNSMNRLQEGNQKLKVQIQQFKTKYTKKQLQISKFTQKINDLQQRLNNSKITVEEKESECRSKDQLLLQAKKDAEAFKAKILEENKLRIEQKEFYERELGKLRQQLQKNVIDSAQALKKEQMAKEQALKADRILQDKNHKEQLRKQKEVNDSLKREKEQLEKQVASQKNLLIQEKKTSARVSAKLGQTTAQLSKLETQINSNQQIQQKMQLKDEEIKKCFATIQSLKSTMSDLEDGIQTYQSMAEEKQREAEEQRSRCVSLEQDIERLQNDIQRLQRKARDVRIQHRAEKVMEDRPVVVDKKEASILPIKLLFLKYFEPGSNYETKLRTFNTLCEVLSLSAKEQEQMNQYRRTKLAMETVPTEKETLQNKLYSFLSSD